MSYSIELVIGGSFIYCATILRWWRSDRRGSEYSSDSSNSTRHTYGDI